MYPPPTIQGPSTRFGYLWPFHEEGTLFFYSLVPMLRLTKTVRHFEMMQILLRAWRAVTRERKNVATQWAAWSKGHEP